MGDMFRLKLTQAVIAHQCEMEHGEANLWKRMGGGGGGGGGKQASSRAESNGAAVGRRYNHPSENGRAALKHICKMAVVKHIVIGK